jgi:predicted AAA+ superfamily ATPase
MNDMQIISRDIDTREIKRRLDAFPVTAILGPRQCGKTTRARQLGGDHYFWQVHSGSEIDLFWQDGGRNRGAEFSSP